MKRILVTGAAGYVGSALTTRLLRAGYEVTAFDALRFGGESLLSHRSNEHYRFLHGDVRDAEAVARALEGADAVVHLAAIVGDPACAKDPELSEAINGAAARALLETCVGNDRVERFVFASTCSNYGKMEGEGYVTEDSPLRPVSLYAEQKVRMEEQIFSLPADGRLCATSLRFATAYGLSPRPRFDLTVNEFTREVVLGRELQIFGEQFWRPYCHVEDLAGACQLVLESDHAKVASRVFGVGRTDENYQKATLAKLLVERKPEAKISYVHRDEDPRDYRVDFTRIEKELGFKLTRTVPDGIDEFIEAIETGAIVDPDDRRYHNT